MNGSVHVTTVPPFSTLLHPVSAASTVRSTQSSIALSPLSSPAPLSHLINSRHLELFSNFIFEVVSSLDINYSIDTAQLRSMMPNILLTPYLLLEVLAPLALHLSRKRIEQADEYLAEATSLQIEALTLFDNRLSTVNNTNHEANLLFASLLGMYSFGEATMASESDASGFLDRFITYLDLYREVRTVVSEAWAMLRRSNMSSVLHCATEQLRLADSQQAEQAIIMASKLGRSLESGDMSEKSKMACFDAMSRLKMIYQAEFMEKPTHQHSAGLLWAWPALLSVAYTDLLKKRRPESLIVLCYFSVLLHRRRSLWFVDGAGHLVIESVTKSLGSYWKHWLDWPNEMIGKPPLSEHLEETVL